MSETVRKNEINDNETTKHIIIKFSKGYIGTTFDHKGKKLTEIKIPNQDINDKNPWATFVVANKSIHNDKFNDKLAYLYLKSEGTTTVKQSKLLAHDQDGKGIYEEVSKKVTNTELKSMVEFWKDKGLNKVEEKGTAVKKHEDKEQKLKDDIALS